MARCVGREPRIIEQFFVSAKPLNRHYLQAMYGEHGQNVESNHFFCRFHLARFGFHSGAKAVCAKWDRVEHFSPRTRPEKIERTEQESKLNAIKWYRHTHRTNLRTHADFGLCVLCFNCVLCFYAGSVSFAWCSPCVCVCVR